MEHKKKKRIYIKYKKRKLCWNAHCRKELHKFGYGDLLSFQKHEFFNPKLLIQLIFR